MKNKLIIFVLATFVYVSNIFSMQPAIVLPPGFTEVARIVQPEGKTLIMGTANYRGFNQLRLYKYDINNELDKSFGTGGIGFFTGATASIEPVSLKIQPDGKILIYSIVNNQAHTIRLNPDGNYDSTFGRQGTLYDTKQRL